MPRPHAFSGRTYFSFESFLDRIQQLESKQAFFIEEPISRTQRGFCSPLRPPPPSVNPIRLVGFRQPIRDDEKSAAIFKGLGECVPFEGEGDGDGGGSDEDDGPPAKKRRGRPAAGGSKKAGKGSAKKAAGAKKGKGKAKR